MRLNVERIDPEFVSPYLDLANLYSFSTNRKEAFRYLKLAEERRAYLSPVGRVETDFLVTVVNQRTGEMVLIVKERVRLLPDDARARSVLVEQDDRRPRAADVVVVIGGR